MSSELSLSGISKRYPGVLALDNVSLRCSSGEIHAILGENGSGKSTLLKIAAGALTPDAGTVDIAGQRLSAANPELARSLGLAAVYQDNSLIPQLSIAQNLFLATSDETVPYAYAHRWAAQELRSYGLRLDPATLVESLSPSQRQFLEIVKALILRPRVLLLDEPTAALDIHEVAKLHDIVRQIAAEGTTVIYVTHRLPEILALAGRVSVLRDGIFRGTYGTSELSENDLISLMVGRPIETEYPAKMESADGRREVVLRVRNLDGTGFRNLSFDLHRGEIVGFAGAEGNGQYEALRAIGGFGESTGTVTTSAGQIPPNSPTKSIAAGIMMLSGDRTNESIFADLSVRENMTIQVLEQFASSGVINRGLEEWCTRDLVQQLGIVTASVEQPIRSLSGGNAQKAILARSFLYPAETVLIDEPTQGVDANARFDIYRAMRAKAEAGTSFVMRSSDALELAGICDRVLVFSKGNVISELDGDHVTESNIVSSFLSSRDLTDRQASGVAGSLASPIRGWSALKSTWWSPLAFLALLILAVILYAASESDAFMSTRNARHVMLATVPLALVSMAQLNALLVAGFDISVGSLMSVTVVAASFLIAGDAGPLGIVLGIAACLAIGIGVGVANGGLIRGLKINPVITTIAMLSVLQGVALYFRPIPSGFVNSEFVGAATHRIDFVPVSIIGVVVLACTLDYWLYHTRSGLALRAAGFHEEAARRIGLRPAVIHFRAYVLSGSLAAVAGLFLAAEVGVGHPTVGTGFTLVSIAAAVLGGAALTGGRGSFVGALLGALFFALVTNIMPFLGLSAAFGNVISGALTLLAIMLYSGKLPKLRLTIPAAPRQTYGSPAHAGGPARPAALGAAASAVQSATALPSGNPTLYGADPMQFNETDKQREDMSTNQNQASGVLPPPIVKPVLIPAGGAAMPASAGGPVAARENAAPVAAKGPAEGEFDIIVVGSGAAGLSSSLFSTWLGNKVLLLEKAPELGGTTKKAAHWYWVPNNTKMRAMGLSDPKEDCLKYMAKLSRPDSYNPEDKYLGVDPWEYACYEAIYDYASPAVELLAERGALEYRHCEAVPDYWAELEEDKAPTGRVFVTKDARESMSDGGAVAVRTMSEAARREGVDIRTGHRVQRMVLNSKREVVGVECTTPDGKTHRFLARKAVIFASGGFTHDPELRRNFLSAPVKGGCAATTNEGDLVYMAGALGLPLRNMNYAWMCPILLEKAINQDPNLIGTFSPSGDSMIYVNMSGKRVTNEKLAYNESAQAFFQWNPTESRYPNLVLAAIWDQRSQDNSASDEYGRFIVPPGTDDRHVIKGKTLAELAANIDARLAQLECHTGGMRLEADFASNLKLTVKRFNDFASTGKDLDFHRGERAVEQLFNGPACDDPAGPNATMYPLSNSGPYYAALLTGGNLDTKGGPKVTPDGRIVDVTNTPVPGLYGVGNCVASASARAYWAGGATLGPIYAFSYLAANAAHQEKTKGAS